MSLEDRTQYEKKLYKPTRDFLILRFSKLVEKPKNHTIKHLQAELSMTAQKSLAETSGPIRNWGRARQIELTKKLWDSETLKYNEKNKSSFPRVLAIADEIRKAKLGNKVLDFGCGLGILHKILGEEYQYYGCDVSRKVVQMHNSPNIVECDLDDEQLPFRDVRFNYIVCSGVIDYLADVRKFLLDINRYYGHENCLFLITVSNATRLWNRITMLKGHFPKYPPNTINFFSPKDFLNLLLECRFKVLKHYPTSYGNCKPHMLRLALFRTFPSLYGTQFLYLCTKR